MFDPLNPELPVCSVHGVVCREPVVRGVEVPPDRQEVGVPVPDPGHRSVSQAGHPARQPDVGSVDGDHVGRQGRDDGRTSDGGGRLERGA